jgi:aspartyl-tRNA(Asn)/glutamyl-tRNA(Gln) amidotransferase subunit C
MKITTDQFTHIAKLSNLPITDEDNYIADQISQAVDYIAVLNELDTAKTNPTYQVNNKLNVFHLDEIKPSLDQKKAISQAENSTNGYFKTTATINKNQ